MANKAKNKYQIIAFYTDDGKRYFKIGKKIDEEKPLCDNNIEWKLDKNDHPVKTDDYDQALKLCK